MVTLRFALLGLLTVVVMAGCSPAPTPFQQQWATYSARFLDNGRIVDTGNERVSHSEGQGYGMLFAVAANDRDNFESIWLWTQRVLQRKDKLFSWRYRPCPSQDARCIDDKNNASDGEILIAWALLRAATRWDDERYREEALAILAAVKQKLLVTVGENTVLLSGEFGFTDDKGRVQINLSYWVFPALSEFFRMTGDNQWRALHDTGIKLIQEAASAPTQLPADWLWLSAQGLSATNTLSSEYGYNACRIPLHLLWDKQQGASLMAPFINFWSQPEVPATVNVLSGEKAEYQATVGMQAIGQLLRADSSPLPVVDEHQDYFSASLIMLSRMAQQDLTS